MSKPAEPYFILLERALDQVEAYRPDARDEFLEEKVLQDAILLQLLQVGENLRQLRELNYEAFERGPESWGEVIGLRNTIAHGYQRVRADLIWQYLVEDLDEFRSSIMIAKSEGWFDTIVPE